MKHKVPVEENVVYSETGISDEQVKDLTNEIINDDDLNVFDKKDQLNQVIEDNELNCNQTAKIQRIIKNLRPTGRSLGQALIDAEDFSAIH